MMNSPKALTLNPTPSLPSENESRVHGGCDGSENGSKAERTKGRRSANRECVATAFFLFSPSSRCRKVALGSTREIGTHVKTLMGTDRSDVTQMSASPPPTIVVPAAPKTPEKNRAMILV